MSKERPCLFCAIAQNLEPCVTVYEDDICKVFMDLYPVSPGHIQIVPKKHFTFYHELPANTRNHLARITQQVADAVLKSELGATGYNLMNNNGKSANQHVGHVHLHVIPRYPRDALKILGHFMLHIPGAFIMKASSARLEQQAEQIARHL